MRCCVLIRGDYLPSLTCSGNRDVEKAAASEVVREQFIGCVSENDAVELLSFRLMGGHHEQATIGAWSNVGHRAHVLRVVHDRLLKFRGVSG